MKAERFNNHVCKNEHELLDRLDLPILDVIILLMELRKPLQTQRYFEKYYNNLPDFLETQSQSDLQVLSYRGESLMPGVAMNA